MGLAQRRILQEYQTEKFEPWKKELTTIVGEVPVEVKWDTMVADNNDDKNYYFNSFDKIYFNCITQVFKNLCADDMGKDAVKSSLKKIVIDGTEGSSPNPSTYVDGVFTVKHKICNQDNGHERIKVWTKLIESKL